MKFDSIRFLSLFATPSYAMLLKPGHISPRYSSSVKMKNRQFCFPILLAILIVRLDRALSYRYSDLLVCFEAQHWDEVPLHRDQVNTSWALKWFNMRHVVENVPTIPWREWTCERAQVYRVTQKIGICTNLFLRRMYVHP